MDTKKIENSEAAAEEAKKRTYVPQTDVPNTTLDDALRVPCAVMENYARKAATPLQVASALKMTPFFETFRNCCGASIAYGLTAGGYNDKEITVEPLSKRILAPLEEGDDLVAKREAALKPRILGEFIRRYENSPLTRDDIALDVLVEMGVPREKTVSVYTLTLDTAQAVGLIREIRNKQYIDLSGMHAATKLEVMTEAGQAEELPPSLPALKEREATPIHKELGQGIFVAHGKNKKPLEQLKRILGQFRIPYKVAVDEPNLGRPIGAKVKEIMESCNCATLISTADEEFQDKEGRPTWLPSENVVYELGASGYVYGSRIVILKEDTVEFPTNFRDLGYISFAKDQLEAKSMDVLKELIGFGIVKIST